MQHTVKIEATFMAKVEIEAQTLDDAESIAMQSFGCVSPSWAASDDRVSTWDAQIHPEKRLIKTWNPQAVSSEAGFRATGIDWSFADALRNKARHLNDLFALSTATVALMDVFNAFPETENIEIAVHEDICSDDSGGYSKSYYGTFSANGQEASEQAEAMIEDEMQDDKNMGVIYRYTEMGKLCIARSDVEPYLQSSCFDLLDVLKQFAANPSTGLMALSIARLEGIES